MPDYVEAVAQALTAPPLLILRPALQPELLTGIGNLPRFTTGDGAVSYGAIFSVQSVPDKLGRTSEPRPIYDLPLIILTQLERLQTGASVVSGRIEIHQLDEVVRWYSFPLSAMEYNCLPGVSFAWSYLYLL